MNLAGRPDHGGFQFRHVLFHEFGGGFPAGREVVHLDALGDDLAGEGEAQHDDEDDDGGQFDSGEGKL